MLVQFFYVRGSRCCISACAHNTELGCDFFVHLSVMDKPCAFITKECSHIKASLCCNWSCLTSQDAALLSLDQTSSNCNNCNGLKLLACGFMLPHVL